MSLRLLLNLQRPGSHAGRVPKDEIDETAIPGKRQVRVGDTAIRHNSWKRSRAFVRPLSTLWHHHSAPSAATAACFCQQCGNTFSAPRQLAGVIGRPDQSVHAPLRSTAVRPGHDPLEHAGAGSTLLLTDKRDGQRAVVSVAPICVDPYRERTPPENLGLVWLTTTNEAAQTPVRDVAKLFNLTPAEQNLLSSLTGGIRLRDAAAHLNVSIHTVRNQLKSILNKTGRHSQAQLRGT